MKEKWWKSDNESKNVNKNEWQWPNEIISKNLKNKMTMTKKQTKWHEKIITNWQNESDNIMIK